MDFADRFYYDETSPSCLRWKSISSTRIKVGDTAGCKDHRGYWVVKCAGKRYYVHRVIFHVLHMDFPEGVCVDHINGDKGNNKISNMRLVTQRVNSQNKTIATDNKTGVTGVTLQEWKGRLYFYASAFDITGKRYRKSFRIDILGKEKAFKLACECRQNMIELFNEQGTSYTERHGT